jgi:hypothetical protein
MNNLHLKLFFVLAILLLYGCKNDSETFEKEEYNLSEVQVEYDKEYCYTNTSISLLIDKPCKQKNIKVIFDDKEAEILNFLPSKIVVKVPDGLDDTVTLFIKDDNYIQIIKEELKIYQKD